MSECCPKCYARVGRCDCHDTDPEMVAERIDNLEEKVALLEDESDAVTTNAENMATALGDIRTRAKRAEPYHTGPWCEIRRIADAALEKNSHTLGRK